LPHGCCGKKKQGYNPLTSKQVADKIGEGMILHVSHTTGVRLVEGMHGRRIGVVRTPISVPAVTFTAMKPYMTPLKRESDPPTHKRKTGMGFKYGWEEMMLPDPGDGEYYLFTQ
jgi:hypothetical protein